MKNNSQNKRIAVKVICIIEHDGRLLLDKGYDKIKNETFFRIIGGSVNFGEKAEEALRREMREELNSEIENLQFLKVIENIFIYEGEKGHEIAFLYKGDLSNKEIYKKDFVHVLDDVEGLPAEWVPISDILEEKIIFYPSFDYKQLFSELF